MDLKRPGNEWKRYADASFLHRPGRALGGMIAATGAAVLSLPFHVNAGTVYSVDKTLTWGNNSGTQTLAVSLLSGNQIKLVGSGYLGDVVGARASFNAKAAVVSPGAINGTTAGQAVKFNPGSSIKRATLSLKIGTHPLRRGTNLFSYSKTTKVRYGKFSSNKSNGKKQFAVFSFTKGAVAGDVGWVELILGGSAGGDGLPYSLEAVAYGVGDANSATIPAAPEPTAGASIVTMLLLAGAGSALQAWRKRRLAA